MMKKILQTALLAGVILTGANALGQTTNQNSKKVDVDQKTKNTYFDILINAVNTNFNYGEANAGLGDYKKEAKGIQAGVSFQAGISPAFSLVSEFYFMMKGAKLKSGNPLTSSELTQRLYGLELPVLARVHAGKFHVNAGPSIAYNLSGTRKVNGVSDDILFKNSVDGFKRFEAGAQMGGGYTFKVKQKRVALDLRYNYGLTNISQNREIRNRSFVVSVHTSPRWSKNPLGK